MKHQIMMMNRVECSREISPSYYVQSMTLNTKESMKVKTSTSELAMQYRSNHDLTPNYTVTPQLSQ